VGRTIYLRCNQKIRKPGIRLYLFLVGSSKAGFAGFWVGTIVGKY